MQNGTDKPLGAWDRVRGLDGIRWNTYILLAAVWLIALGVALAGYRYYQHEKTAIEREARLQLAGIAELKVRQVRDWRNERIADAKVVAASPLSPAVQAFLTKGRTTREAELEISDWLETIRSAAGYANVILVSPAHQRWIAVGKPGSSAAPYFALARVAMERNEVALTDFHQDGGLSGPHLGLNLPLHLGPKQPAVGALLIGIDPGEFLYPLIQWWPTASRTAETLLARSEGDEVVYLNELRHRKDTALRLRLPLGAAQLPAARGASGFEGMMDGVDYRGVPVVAAVRKIPGVSWVLVAKVDLQEIHEPVERQTFWLALTGLSVLLTFGTGVTFLVRDLRARFDIQQSRADLEQRALRGHYDYLSKYANDIILLTNKDRSVVEANDRAVMAYGYTRDELIGMPLLELRAPETLDSFEQQWQATEEQESLIFESRHRRKDGSTFPVEVSSRRVAVDDTVFRQGIIRDITERREAEREHAILQEQLQQAQRMECIGRLAGGVAHDFNNLLTVINGYSAMILEGMRVEDPLRDEIHEIHQAGERAASLTRQLLAFSRKQIIEPKRVNLNGIVNNLVKMLRRLVGEDVAIVTELAQELDAVFVDPGQMEQVLMNLATNSRDAMPEGGRFTIGTRNVTIDDEYALSHIEAKAGACVRLSVTDTGEGMSAETLEHAFEPFFTTKERGQGTGLGLATVYGAIKQAKGWIAVDSQAGTGTRFDIYLPRSEGLGLEAERVVVAVGRDDDGRGTETVLLVEDQSEVRKLACEALEHYGYRVLGVGNGDDALALCEGFDGTIHLIVTDVVMPSMTGPELAKRALVVKPGMKVLYMSGYAETLIAHQGIVDAGLAYLQKPFTADVLARKARSVLDGE